jgi:hypothetical protein
LHYSPELLRSETRIQGLERLIDRWRDFKPAADESAILHHQILLLNSIVQLNYPPEIPVRITHHFPGNKIKGGVFLFISGDNSPAVIKIDRVSNIEAETKNYRLYVKPCLNRTPGEPYIPKQRHVYIDENAWGGIMYNLLDAEHEAGKQVLALADYCHDHSADAIGQALTQVFKALEPWWNNRPHSRSLAQAAGQPPLALAHEYNRLFRYRPEIQDGIAATGTALGIASLQSINWTQPCLQLAGQLEISNPLYWIDQTFLHKDLLKQLDQPNLRCDSLIHGDLHAHNILIGDVAGKARAWIIDFPRVHLGPTVQDLASLEATMVAEMINDSFSELTLEDWLVFVTALLPPSSPLRSSLTQLTPTELPELLPIRPQLEAIRQVVLRLRREVIRFPMGGDPRPYYLALAHATLPMMKYRDLKPIQKLAVFLIAAVLCDRF